MTTEATYTPDQRFASDIEVGTDKVTVKSGQDLVALELVMVDAEGKVVAHDGGLSSPTSGIMIDAVDAAAGDTPGATYNSGCLRGDKVVWPAAANTNELKQALLAGTALSVKFYAAGEK